MVKRLALALLVLFVAVLLAVYWGVRVSQKAVVPELKPSRHVVERFIDNPDSIHFSRDEREPPHISRKPTTYFWAEEDIKRTWSREIVGDSITFRSPPLDFNSLDEIDSIVIKMADLHGLTHFILMWNDEPVLPRAKFLRNRREFITSGKRHSATFFIRGDNICDLGNGTEEEPVNYLFLRFPFVRDDEVLFDFVHVVSKAGVFGVSPSGQDRQVLRGEVRDTLYIRTPGEIIYRTSLAETADLLFGVHSLDPLSVVQYTVRIDTDVRAVTVFDQNIEETGEWHDFRVHLSAVPRQNSQVVIHLFAESNRPGNIAFWSSPMIVAPNHGKGRPNVILYLVDALRADHLRVYGYQQPASPFLDEFAERGVVFRNCYSPASWTKPSVVTLMTSLYPQTHQVGALSFTDVLPEGVKTLAEYMSENGYVTASFSANPLSSTLSNLDQGFDYTFTPRSFRKSNPEAKNDKIHSDELNAKILPWIDSHARDAFFLYIHSMDTHRPHSPPVRPDDLGGRSEKIDLYDFEISFNDRQIERLYKKLVDLGLVENTIFIVTSDHGEVLDDRGTAPGHGRSVYQEETHVPLLMVHPKELSPRVVNQPVQLVDLMPTILEHCSIPYERSTVQGVDILQNLGKNAGRRIFLTRFLYPMGDSEVPEFEDVEYYGIVEDQWKLIMTERKGQAGLTFELYDLENDPLERLNLSQLRKEQVSKMYSAWLGFIDDQKKHREAFVLLGESERSSKPTPQDLIDRLRSLGYIN